MYVSASRNDIEKYMIPDKKAVQNADKYSFEISHSYQT